MRTSRRTTAAPGLLDGLGLVGLGEIEPVVIAAVAAELPMLLVGPHGTGKSLLLTRIAEALGLAWRHYNASLLSYDDLVGYPVPDGHGGLDWLRTPATIWDAEAVFLDEINRCRPDLQNKLFPIVHERRVQGIELTAPPPPLGRDEPGQRGRRGRCVPRRRARSTPRSRTGSRSSCRCPTGGRSPRRSRSACCCRTSGRSSASAAEAFRAAVASARERYLDAVARPDPALAVYVRHALRLLDEAGLRCSPRRGSMLVRTIAAVRATGALAPADAAFAALRFGLPQRASGGRVEEHKVLGAHRGACSPRPRRAGDPVHGLLAIADPFERTVRALELRDLDPTRAGRARSPTGWRGSPTGSARRWPSTRSSTASPTGCRAPWPRSSRGRTRLSSRRRACTRPSRRGACGTTPGSRSPGRCPGWSPARSPRCSRTCSWASGARSGSAGTGTSEAVRRAWDDARRRLGACAASAATAVAGAAA